MLSLLLFALPTVASTVLAPNTDAEHAFQMSSNGEFIARNYPPGALKRGEQGKVGFRLVVEPDGSLGSCEVTQTSGFKSLDDETCELIVRHARLGVVRDSEGRAVRAIQDGYISWRLPAGVAARPATTRRASVAGKADDPEKIICKKSQTTGSLISRTKQCMTARQWAEAQRQARERAERIIGSGYAEDGDGCPGLKPDC